MRHVWQKLFLQGGPNPRRPVVLLALSLSPTALAQPSPDCNSAQPCVRVGLEDPQRNNDFASKAEHFLYSEADADDDENNVTVTVLALFNEPVICGSCDHFPTPREWEWKWQGSGSEVTVDPSQIEIVGSYFQKATIELTGVEAGDTITVTCHVKDIEGRDCYEDKRGRMGYHIEERHDGAFASCTIKLWRMDLEASVALDPTFGYPHYQFQFANDVTNTATLIGASPHDFDWKSWVDSQIYTQNLGAGSSWSGEIVAYTSIVCQAKVVNACDITAYSYRIQSVYLSPTIRRPGWTMSASLDGQETNWLSSFDGAFPQADTAKWNPPGALYAYGQNTNSLPPYKEYSTTIVTPIYLPQSGLPDNFEDFESTTSQIISGPNIGFYYNDDPSFFAVKRLARFNHWIKFGVGHPAIPANDKNGNPFTDWASLLSAQKGPHCRCQYPADHDGQLADAHYQANKRHETFGSTYLGTQNAALGHQGLIEDAVENDDPLWFDAVYRCDLLYADSISSLLIADDNNRSYVTKKLLERTLQLHQPWYLSVSSLRIV